MLAKSGRNKRVPMEPGALGGKDWGQKKVVRLILEENKGPKGSVASTLSAAVLLKRTTIDSFVAQIQANAEADMGYSAVTKIRRLSGKTPLDDPVIFDPQRAPTMNVADASNLAAENLGSIAIIISTTVFSTVNDRTSGSG